nr:unnamed protein product [Spirometra erinaceieuropaei]
MSGLVPTGFSATALNSSAIRVTWKKPRRSDELSSKYELTVYNSTHEVGFTLRVTEDIHANLEPSTTYNLTVRAFWSNDTRVDAVAFTSVTTRLRENERIPVYNLCKKEHKECEFIPYREKDTTKGKGCRDACAKQREKINGTFDAFNKCAFQCDGWPDLKNSLEDTAIFCPREGYCQDAKFFSKPDDENRFESLMTCFKNCTSA